MDKDRRLGRIIDSYKRVRADKSNTFANMASCIFNCNVAVNIGQKAKTDSVAFFLRRIRKPVNNHVCRRQLKTVRLKIRKYELTVKGSPTRELSLKFWSN